MQRPLSHVAKRSVAQIVAQGDGLHKVGVQPQGDCDGAGNLGDLQGVGQTGPPVVVQT